MSKLEDLLYFVHKIQLERKKEYNLTIQRFDLPEIMISWKENSIERNVVVLDEGSVYIEVNAWKDKGNVRKWCNYPLFHVEDNFEEYLNKAFDKAESITIDELIHTDKIGKVYEDKD